MDWTLVRSFLATVEAGSLSAAARQLGLTQPTLGRHIQELEQILGLTLFVRSQKGLVPTEAGEDLMDTARSMRDAADAFLLVATGRGETVSGTVRVAAGGMVAVHLLPAVLAPLRIAHPEIQFEVTGEAPSGTLLRRDADVAIRPVRPVQPDLVAHRAAGYALGLFGATAYLDRRGRPRAAAELVGHDLVGHDRDDGLIRSLAAGGLAVDRSDFALRSDDHAVRWAMVQAGLGLGFAPLWVGNRTPGVERVRLPLRIPSQEIWLCTHREVAEGRRLRLVTDALVDGFSALPLGEDASG